MKFLICILTLTICNQIALAAPLSCEIKINGASELNKTVETSLNQKMIIGETDSFRSFVTEKENNFFSLEVFLGPYEARIYSEAYLKEPGDKLNLNFWGRDMLLEIQCQNHE